MGKNDRIVFRRPDGIWVNKRDNSHKASSLHRKQLDVEKAARRMLKKSGSGELTIENSAGKVLNKPNIEPWFIRRKVIVA